ncbi:MAG: hypothetical protein WEC34_04080 [Acidimicrobiia bacterium]
MTKPKRDLDEPVVIPLDPEDAIRALMQVDPEGEPAEKAAEREDSE